MEKKVFDLLEKMYTEFNDRFEKIDTRFEQMDRRFDSLERQVIKNGEAITKLEDQVMKNGEAITKLEDQVMKNREAIEKLDYRLGKEIELTRKELKTEIQYVHDITKKIDNKLNVVADDVEYLKHKEAKNEEELFKIKNQLKVIK